MDNNREKASQHVRTAVSGAYDPRPKIAANLGASLIYVIIDGIDAYRERTEVMRTHNYVDEN